MASTYLDWIIRKSALPLFLNLQHHHLRHSRSLYLCTGHHPFEGWNNVVQDPSLLLVGRNFLVILNFLNISGKCRPTPFSSFGGIQYSRISTSVKQIEKKMQQMVGSTLLKIFSQWSIGKNTDLAICIEGAGSFHVGDHQPELFSHFLFSSQNHFLCILTGPDIELGIRNPKFLLSTLWHQTGLQGSELVVRLWKLGGNKKFCQQSSSFWRFIAVALKYFWNCHNYFWTLLSSRFPFSSYYFWHKRRSRSLIEIQSLPRSFEINTWLKKSSDSWQKITYWTHHWRRLHYIIGLPFVF